VSRPQRGIAARSTAGWIEGLSIFGVLAAFAARLPAIVAPFGPDQGVYVTVGWGLSRGLMLYRDLWEMKPPGIYVTYWLGLTLFGSGAHAEFWLDFLAAAITCAAVFGIGRRLAGVRMGALAALVVAVGTLPAARYGLGGFLERSVTETFIIPVAACAVWAAVQWLDSPRAIWPVIAGLLIGTAVVYKQTAAIYWPALIVWVAWTAGFARARRFALQSAAGLLVAPLAAFLWLWWAGALHDAYITLVSYNVAYLRLGDQGLIGTLDRFAHEVWRRQRDDELWALGSIGSVVGFLVALGARGTASARVASLGVVWFGAALIAVAANGPRLFTTYFMPPQIPLCLLAAWLFYEGIGLRPRWRIATGAFLLALTAFQVVRSGSAARAVSAISWDLQYINGHIDRMAYLERYRSQSRKAFNAADNQRLADYVAAHTDATERIFVFGMTAGTYYSSQRLPANRFLFAYPAVSNMGNRPEYRVETLAADLGLASPRYIILQRGNGDSFSGWKAAEAFTAPPLVALLERYSVETEIGDFLLYRRRD
jgi:4-amino-4-deoxy-L-arabinose transferase-like glycosyltransferase